MTEYRANRMKEAKPEAAWDDPMMTEVELAENNAPPATEPGNEEQEKKSPKKNHKGRKRLQEVLGGDYLSKKSVAGNIPFVLYLAVLVLMYIANTYNTERMYKQIERTKTELKELRYRYITARSELMFQSKLSELNKRVKQVGLKETLIPPYKIFYSEDSLQNGVK